MTLRGALIALLSAGIVLFGWDLSEMLRTGAMRGRVQMISKDRNPVAFAVGIAANIIGMVLFLIVIVLLALGEPVTGVSGATKRPATTFTAAPPRPP